MIVSQVNKILKDSKMQNKETNFKLKEKKPPGGVKSRKPSLVQQILIKLDKFIDKQEKFNKKQEKNWKEQRKFNKKQEKNWKEQRKFNKLIIKRIDNIVQKNNLKE